MAMKAAAVWWLMTGEQKDRESLNQMLSALDRYHGQPFGIFSADEHYAGLDPSQGTELCAVVEAMFSLETDISILGDAALGDRLEKIAYNALPGTLTADLWGHQYDQQANQVIVSVANRRWSTNGPESNIFGLEPNFGCCTANMHQGWPKFAAHLWMATADGGLAAVAYGPSEVSTQVAGGRAREHCGDYGLSLPGNRHPAREDCSAREVSPRAANSRHGLTGATVAVNGTRLEGVKPGEFYRVEREWKNGDAVELRFPMRVRHFHLVQQLHCRGARAAGFFTEDRRELVPAAANWARHRLGSLSHHAVELRAGHQSQRGGIGIYGHGTSRWAPTLQPRRCARGD